MTKEEVNAKSPLKLAYVGDAVLEIIVRKFLISTTDFSPNTLHKMALTYVSAPNQSVAIDSILDSLTDEETCIYKRGRNAKSSHLPKSSSVEDYHKATGFECLIGYLYLIDELERLNFIISKAFNIEL
ncbi:MAG: ribonuclease III domain-containing protein [Clostridia bacterium]